MICRMIGGTAQGDKGTGFNTLAHSDHAFISRLHAGMRKVTESLPPGHV
jgi:hypothetical protein